ncbi:GAF domain-containing protein [Paraferrimonas sp. SM1919]|uniref:GAF domain-containing protein n=1 Tax=Paraferrimonas sp. SM1919 TaxID=2662263 RepID=UPI0013D0DE7A|nr:GAF domain-containing protein [Paraferrimonas sp. SM1919]
MTNIQEQYRIIALQAEALLESESNQIAQLANLSALLNEHLADINWVGFYLNIDQQLVLGPFQGKVACTRIPFGRGVCGVAASTGQIQRVADVHQFEGHIACDSASNSEMVLPIILDNKVFGVLDIDSPSLNRFTEEDEKGLKNVVEILKKVLTE